MEEKSNTQPSENLESFGFPGQYDANGVDLSLIRANLIRARHILGAQASRLHLTM